MGAVIANLVNHPEGGAPTTDNNREEVLRTKAFYIWLDEGCPEGRADSHWQLARQLVATEEGSVALAPQLMTKLETPGARKPRKPSN